MAAVTSRGSRELIFTPHTPSLYEYITPPSWMRSSSMTSLLPSWILPKELRRHLESSLRDLDAILNHLFFMLIDGGIPLFPMETPYTTTNLRPPLTNQRNAHKRQDSSLFRNRKPFSSLAMFRFRAVYQRVTGCHINIHFECKFRSPRISISTLIHVGYKYRSSRTSG